MEKTSRQFVMLKKNSQNNSQISNNSSYVSKSSEQTITEDRFNLLNKLYCETEEKLK